MSRRWWLIVLGAIAVVLVGAGLVQAFGGGAGDSNTTTTTAAQAAETWAGGVCGALGTWKQDVTTAVTSAKSNITKDGLTKALDDVKTATSKLHDSLAAVGDPPTPAADQARTALQTLQDALQKQVDAIKQALDNASGVAGLAAAAPTITASFTAMKAAFSTAASSLRSLPTGTLATGFSDAPACQSLGSNA
jgi:hypothetical protein